MKSFSLLTDLQQALSLPSFIIAILTLIATILTAVIAIIINSGQERRDKNNRLFSYVIESYNYLETDIILLAQGTYDKHFNKDLFDKELLLAISNAKGYAITIDNENLFLYLNSILTGEDESKFANLTEEYFAAREKISIPSSELKKKAQFYRSKSLVNQGLNMLDMFLKKIRDCRDDAIVEIRRRLKAK